eukprot:Gb_13594 [translate_table: standard]
MPGIIPGDSEYSRFSLFGSSVTVGGMLGAIVSGKTADVLGRKGALAVSAIPNVIGWVTVAASKGVTPLYLGRFIIGFGMGISSFTVSEAPCTQVLNCTIPIERNNGDNEPAVHFNWNNAGLFGRAILELAYVVHSWIYCSKIEGLLLGRCPFNITWGEQG